MSLVRVSISITSKFKEIETGIMKMKNAIDQGSFSPSVQGLNIGVGDRRLKIGEGEEGRRNKRFFVSILFYLFNCNK